MGPTGLTGTGLTGVLALDMALRTGWAFGTSRGPERWGSFDVSAEVGLGPRLVRFENRLKDLVDELNLRRGLDWIWIERVCGHSGAAVNLARGFQAVLLLVASKHGLGVHDIAPNALKKAITGNGRAPKNDMQLAAARYAGIDVTARGWGDRLGYDEADALCLLKHGLAVLEARKA